MGGSRELSLRSPSRLAADAGFSSATESPRPSGVLVDRLQPPANLVHALEIQVAVDAQNLALLLLCDAALLDDALTLGGQQLLQRSELRGVPDLERSVVCGTRRNRVSATRGGGRGAARSRRRHAVHCAPSLRQSAGSAESVCSSRGVIAARHTPTLLLLAAPALVAARRHKACIGSHDRWKWVRVTGWLVPRARRG